jgi:beta-lactamase regulating signal transducer with metallopeptidase domain
MSIDAVGSAGAILLTWHFLLLGISLTGLLLERILRGRNAHARSALLRSTLALAAALPLVCTVWLAFPSHSATPSVVVPAQDSEGTASKTELSTSHWDHVAVWRPLVSDLERVPDDLLPVKATGVPARTVAFASFLIFSALISILLLWRFLMALVRCVSLRRSGTPIAREDEASYRDIAAAMRVAAPPALRVEQLESPVLIGFFRPFILLPADIALRDEIFIHELTHLRRHDLKWHLLARLATMLMPLQPGFWFLKKALERADEDVCDDTVLVRGMDAAAYANLLLHVAESQNAPSPELCLPMAAFRSQLERRLSRLLDATRPLARRLSVPVLCFGLGPLLSVGFIAGAIYLDTERTATAADDKTTPTTPLPPVSKPAATADTPLSNSSGNGADVLNILQKELLEAQQDAAHRQVLYESTKALSDADFIATMTAMGRVSPSLTSIQTDVLNQKRAVKNLLKQGFAEEHPRVQAVETQLAQDRDQFKTLIAGARNALKIDADMAEAGVKILQDKVQTTKYSGSTQISAQKELVGDVGRLYHAMVYSQTSGDVPKLTPTSWQFIADLANNAFPITGGSVTLPSGEAWKTDPVAVVGPDLLVGAHYLYAQGFPSESDLLSNFPNGKYAFNIQPGGSIAPYSVPVSFTGTVKYPPIAPVITNTTWDSGALVLDPTSPIINFTNYPGATLTWEILIPGKTYIMSAGGRGTSVGSLNLTGMLSYGQTYQAQLRFINRDKSSVASDPSEPKDYGYSTIMARIVEFKIKTSPR